MKLPVTKPGVYSIEINAYHGQRVCDGVSVSSSTLRQILRQSPAHYWAFSDLNPNRLLREDTEPLAFGRAAHCTVLDEPIFDDYFIISPFDDFRTKEARGWRDEQTKQIIKPAEWATVQAMAAAQKSSAAATNAFKEGRPEMSIIWKDEETGLWLKSRPDWLPNDPTKRLTTEYKSCVTLDPRRLSNAAYEYGYHLQAAMVLDGIEIVTGTKPVGMCHVCQEKTQPYLCELRLFTPEQIDLGRQQYRKALRIFADCIAKNEWPGYAPDGVLYFDTPRWVLNEMESQDEAA